MDDGEVQILIEFTREQTDASIFNALRSKNKVEVSKMLLRYLFIKIKELQALIVSTKARVEEKTEELASTTMMLNSNRSGSEFDTLIRKIQNQENENIKRGLILKELKNNILLLLGCFILVGFVYVKFMPVGLALSFYVLALLMSLGYSYFIIRKEKEDRSAINIKERLFKQPDLKQILQSKLLADLKEADKELDSITTQVNSLHTDMN
jgi:hypothetical protein